MLSDKELVDYITNELLKRLEPSSAPEAKPPLYIVGGHEGLELGILAELEESFDFIDHGQFELPQYSDAPMLISKLSLPALVSTANGDEGYGGGGRVLLSALWAGRRVVLLKSGLAWRRFRAGMAEGLIFLYERYERRLMKFGVRIVEDLDLLKVLTEPRFKTLERADVEPKAAFKPLDNTGNLQKKEVLTEAVIMSLCPPAKGLGQDAVIDKDTIITPLAWDYLKEIKANLIRGG